jgi:hypothetical protein
MIHKVTGGSGINEHASLKQGIIATCHNGFNFLKNIKKDKRF